MKIYNEQNNEIEINCPCGSEQFDYDSIGYYQGLICKGCKVFRTVDQWVKLTNKEDIFSKEKELFE